MSSVHLTPAEAIEIEHFINALDYEYGAIREDLEDPDEKRSFTAKIKRNDRHAAAMLVARTSALGTSSMARPVLIERDLFNEICADLAWLAENWVEAMKAMDDVDRQDYRVAAIRLETLELALARK